tara:strand:+ start:8361 stop:8957 length:597 start_codon:yes stop_codon:yes gene_type:complete
MIELKSIIKTLNLKGYQLFENDEKPFNLNIVGVRSSSPEVNKFNDSLSVFWKYESRWNFLTFQATTLAGLKYLETPMNPKGCAILKPNQYLNVWELGPHGKSKYIALTQRKGEVEVYRDENEDRKYDMYESKVDKGYFGINIHKASKGERETVDGYSAGCQVIQNEDEFDIFISICKKSQKYWGNSFSYTLLKEEDLI